MTTGVLVYRAQLAPEAAVHGTDSEYCRSARQPAVVGRSAAKGVLSELASDGVVPDPGTIKPTSAALFTVPLTN